MDRFTSQLRQRAKELGLSHGEIARRSGLTENRFGHYATGRSEPDFATLLRIAKVLQTTPNELLGVGSEKADRSRKTVLRERLFSAAEALNEKDLELAVAQTEMLVKFRRAGK